MEEARRHLADFIVARLVRLNSIRPEQLEIDLNPADREKAARYRFPADRTRFLAGRALLAKMLARYVGPGADLTRLTLTETGRPVLPTEPSTGFSISHAGDLVMVALAKGMQVGVDVERMARPLDFDGLARRIFNERDLADFLALPSGDQEAAFFRAWTAKEAILKAQGVGLSGRLREVSVSWRNNVVAIDVPDQRAWRLRRLPVPEGYVAHLAWEGPNREIDFREVTLEEGSPG